MKTASTLRAEAAVSTVTTTHPTAPSNHRLGDRLCQLGLISEQQLAQALEVQRRTESFLGQVLIDLGFLSSQALGGILSQQFGIPYVDLLSTQPDPDAVRLVPEQVIRETQSIPLRLRGESLELAMLDPLDVAAVDAVSNLTGRRVLPRLTMSWELQRTINDFFAASARTSEALLALENEAADTARTTRIEVASASEAPIVRLVDSLIEGAMAFRASDIHFEPQEREVRVRYRIDGTLMEHAQIPRPQQAAVTARLKVLASMDVTETRRPQDGRLSFNNHGRIFDVRVSSVPTVFGEKLVLRILDKASVTVPLSRLGFDSIQQGRFESLIRRPHGMVVVVGPTGSGKSTTLYSALNTINDTTRNIMTLEDPVEYNVAGISQVQVNPRIGLTFASGLRSFVRQDPDVILVGEIRDGETAEMAIQASLTGHLMLSTLHANSAVGTIARLTNLGVDAFLVSQALGGVVSQRLIARVCAHCAVEYRPTLETLVAVGIPLEDAPAMQFRRGVGCRTCHFRGYMGRTAAFEVLTIDDVLRLMITRRAPEPELQEAAERAGMRTLRQAVLELVRTGVTTPEEMGRIVLSQEN